MLEEGTGFFPGSCARASVVLRLGNCRSHLGCLGRKGGVTELQNPAHRGDAFRGTQHGGPTGTPCVYRYKLCRQLHVGTISRWSQAGRPATAIVLLGLLYSECQARFLRPRRS